MKRFIAGVVIGALLVGGTAFAATSARVRVSHGDVVRIDLNREVTCIVGSRLEQALACQRTDGRGYLIFLAADGSAAIRRNNRTTTCLWPEAYCTSKGS